MQFHKRTRFMRLHPVIENCLRVPANSATVKRVFSRSGLFVRPHRTRLGEFVYFQNLCIHQIQ